jgi:formate hydrogenlyase subunit 3/multisubunit Na+/H+ antiporter MnhD subunit
MFVVYLVLGVYLIFFADLDPDKFPMWARLAMGVLLIVYAVIRFLRLINQKED